MKNLLIATALLIFLTAPAKAWHIELESSDNLIWGILFTSDEGGNQMEGYFLDFYYDIAELNWEKVGDVTDPPALAGYYGLYTNTPPSGLTADFQGKPSQTADGFIQNFNGTEFWGSATVDGTISLGTFTFTKVSSVLDGVSDLQLALDSNMFGMTLDGEDIDGDVLTIVANEEGYFKAATSSPVPEPGTFVLLSLGVLGMVGFSRRKKNEITI